MAGGAAGVAPEARCLDGNLPVTVWGDVWVMDWGEYTKFIVALVVIVNPIGAVPVFLSLTDGASIAEQRSVARTAAVAVVLTLIAATLLGDMLLRFFGISVASFRVGGGILILLMAIAMLHARRSGLHQTREEAEEAEEMETVAVVPLAVPLLAGPGAISTVIVASHRAVGWLDFLLLCAGVVLLGALLWFCMFFATPIGRYLGRTGINIATRIMGLLLIAIAVEFITGGLRELLPGLAGALGGGG